MSSIIDNREDNTLLQNLQIMSNGGREISIATAFFSLDALLLLSETLRGYQRIRILFGDDASAVQRQKLLGLLRKQSDEDLLLQREQLPNLSPLRGVADLFAQGRVEARCYTKKKFHAKAYLVHRPQNTPPKLGIIGSGNFTRPGLTQNVELNVALYVEQTSQLETWFEERWEEAAADVVTEDVLAEIRRQITLYDPYALYLKALYTWGEAQQAAGLVGRTALQEALDPHQEQGYLRALKILDREHGVMVCDGVGLGKSYIALALMENYCQNGKRVLLIAPKNIMTSSWSGYLETYLEQYRKPFGTIEELAMTELGYESESLEDEALSNSLYKKLRLATQLMERADMVVIDESHNFRASDANRYVNLSEILKPARNRKDVVLLTATPINTAYVDISNQLHLITQDDGRIGGFSDDQIRRSCRDLDREMSRREAPPPPEQLSLDLGETPSETLNKVLQGVVIQRSRATCRDLAESTGKELRFPIRSDPRVIDVAIGQDSEAYRELIRLAHRRFQPGVEFIKLMRAALQKADETGKPVLPVELSRGVPRGIKLAAFLTEQYRYSSDQAGSDRKTYQSEVHLASLVFANALKQLESSPVAFQGILQSLGLGLIARLNHVFGSEAALTIAEHAAWVRTPLFQSTGSSEPGEIDTDADVAEDGDTLDASGEEPDAWINQAVRSRQLARKLSGFDAARYDVGRWREDIEADLGFLREIHNAAIAARLHPDPKMTCVEPELKSLIAAGRRVLVFTQSQRTADYLERELRSRLAGANVARIDSRVEDTRAAILYAFCPGYNRRPSKWSPTVPDRVDVLISTDVLSEGVNLQEAGAIVSWDIHWNPVRLIQRIGRVDRRLDPDITPNEHRFDIINVLPPKEIEETIRLVETVENRTLRISRALGLDVSFFKSTDPAGNLKEFNAQYEGRIPPKERALNSYARLSIEPPDARTQAILEALPPGAFGVWQGAPRSGLFALFTMQAKSNASQADKEKFMAVIDQPILVLEGDAPGRPPITDAGEILTLLAGTQPHEKSGTPPDEEDLKQRLAKLKTCVRSQFADIGLPATFAPRLACWIELRANT